MVLDIADLTVDGSICTGAAVCAAMMLQGHSLAVAMLMATLAGMIAGLLSVAIPTLIMTLTTGFTSAAAKSPEMGVIAMAVSFVVVPLVSLMTKKPDSAHVEEVFSCYQENN